MYLDLKTLAIPDDCVKNCLKMQQYFHRDLLGRFIRNGDVVVWSVKHQRYGLQMCQVINSLEKKVMVYDSVLKKRKAITPGNCVVITSQILDNINRNVAASEKIDGDVNREVQ